jgi:hypothetical protein
LKWIYQSTFASFGLTSSYQEAIYEELFALKYHGGFSLFESYSIPVGLRKWFIQRLIKQKEDEKEATEKARKSNK